MEKERERSGTGMNFMEEANINGHGYYSRKEEQNHNQIMMTMATTTSCTHSQRTTNRVGGMVTSTISSSSSYSSSHTHTTTTTTLVAPSPSFNHHHYNREIEGQETSLTEKLDLMDTSPNHSSNVNNNNNNNTDEKEVKGGGLGLRTSNGPVEMERENMFDKVVTPSDVGKLNRLVIPKQHAEKYFPLDSSINDKGLVLNFEDASNGNTWRFRYSYWNSSQSYVMTKGWSRFVKDKKLDAGDIVSFQLGKGRLNKDRLFIDWRRRPNYPSLPPPLAMAFASDNFSLHPLYFPRNRSNMNYRSSPMSMGYWSTSSVVPPPPPPPDVLSLPGQAATPLRGRGWGGGGDHYYHPSGHTPNFITTGYNYNYYGGIGNPRSNVIYFRSAPVTTVVSPQQHQASSTTQIMRFPSSSGSDAGVEEVDPQQQQEVVLLQSVPVAQGKAAAKRLRLFGVNVDCPISPDEECEKQDINILPSTVAYTQNIGATVLMSSPPPSRLVQLRLYNNGGSSPPQVSHHHQTQFCTEYSQHHNDDNHHKAKGVPWK